VDALTTHLIRGFDYDLWANERWLAVIDQLPDPDHARDIMKHVALAQHVWLSRLGRVDREFPADRPLEETLARQTELWKSTLAAVPLGLLFNWTRLRDGVARQGTLEDIARHVINHGTYHRGHLRGLADAAGFNDFEDTDFALFFEPS
jgi:uncharacterized damage-inducible protein DinB